MGRDPLDDNLIYKRCNVSWLVLKFDCSSSHESDICQVEKRDCLFFFTPFLSRLTRKWRFPFLKAKPIQ